MDRCHHENDICHLKKIMQNSERLLSALNGYITKQIGDSCINKVMM